MKKVKLISFLLIFGIVSKTYSQSILENIEEQALDIGQTSASKVGDLPIEKIIKISDSYKIFVLTNTNSSFTEGDYVSLVHDNSLVARAVCGKIEGQNAGLKIIKIYSLDSWKKMKPGLEVKVIKGDDTFFTVKKEKEVLNAKLLDEDQLFDEETFLGENEEKDRSKRLIPTDNIIGASFGQIRSLNSYGESTGYAHYAFHWQFQFVDNIWVDFTIGQSVLQEYPYAEGVSSNSAQSTTLTNATIKAKYTINAPFYSFIQPYMGFQVLQASSDSTLSIEVDQVDALNENNVVFGVGLLKRVVPGWFISASLGTDFINVGLDLEF